MTGPAEAGVPRSRLQDGLETLVVEPGALGATAAELAQTPDTRLADLFATASADAGVVLRAVYGLDAEQTYLIVESPVRGDRYAPLSDLEPAALVEESEIYEQFGLRPDNDAPLQRQVLPPGRETCFPGLSAGTRPPWEEVRPSHLVQGEAFEFPFGPVRAAGWESLYTGLVTTGEELLDLYLFYWHKHRGVERRLVGQRPDRALFLVERAEGLSAVGNGWAFCSAVEAATGVAPPAPAQCSRGVALELERLYNHAAAIAALCQTTGLSVGQAQAEIVLELALRCNLAVFGHRYLFGVLEVGGVRRAPDREALGLLLPELVAAFNRLVAALRDTNSFVDRLEAAGIVTPERARRLGLVGPVGRASGQDVDTRRDHSSPPWRTHPPEVPTATTGDVRARMDVMVEEVADAARLVTELGAEAGGERVPVPPGPGSALGWAESSRGESLAWVALDAEGRIKRARIRPAAVRNWRAFDDAVRSRNVFTDVPIIEASFWLTVAGAAR